MSSLFATAPAVNPVLVCEWCSGTGVDFTADGDSLAVCESCDGHGCVCRITREPEPTDREPFPSPEPDPCLHCEQAPAATEAGLCPACDGKPAVRVLYTRRRGWSPEWETRLRRLAARARRRLPLFDVA